MKTTESQSLLAPIEDLEDRVLLSAILPVFVDGVFSFGDPNSPAPYGLENTFKLASNPTATKTIYLDYTGHHSVNNSWGHDIMFDPFDRDGDPTTFTDTELIEMQLQFQNVVEDFFPFDVNVTTIEPDVEDLINSGGGDTRWGIRSLATQAKDGFGNGIGGVAFIGSFNWDEDAPAFSFNKGENVGGMTQSHEVGHTLFLQHDGLGGQEYHPGSGSGETEWGPIMGAPFNANIVHWSKGEYANSTNNQDDLSEITTRNGFGYKPDDHGDDIFNATELTIVNETEASAWGIIGKTADKDFFHFTTGEGNVQFTIEPFQGRPNLDIQATIYDETGSIVATSNPTNGLGASFDVNLGFGEYYLSIDGVGKSGEYTEYGSLGFYSIVGDIQIPVDPVQYSIGETGLLLLDHNWTTVTLNNTYVDPVIVATVTSNNDADPMTLRIRNVESNRFQIQIDEWDYQNGTHAAENVSYMVIESGIHKLANGLTVYAGNVQANHKWTNVQFTDTLDGAPVVVAQTVSRTGGAAVVTRLDDVTFEGFKVKLQEEEGADGRHSYEKISWIAFDDGVGSFGGLEFDSDSVSGITHNSSSIGFNRTFDATPALLASMQSYNGDNTANVRASDLTDAGVMFNIQEEKSKDNEVGHIAEDVGYVAIDIGDIMGTTRIGEAGRIANLTQEWRLVTLIQTYENPVVVAGLISLNDADEAVVRVRNVTSNSFEIQVDEWDYNNRIHAPETVGYFVVEAGVHKLLDGTKIVANNTASNHHWANVNYGYGLDDTPVLLTQTISENGKSAVTTRTDDVGTNGFRLRLQEEEGADGTHSVERVSWVAIQVGSGDEAGYAHQSILRENVTDQQQFVAFANIFSRTPVVFGGVQSFEDSDTVSVREAAGGSSVDGVNIFLQEEQSFDSEKAHGPEMVGIFALDRGTTPGTTIDFFGGPTFGQSPQAYASQLPMAIVPRITYVDNAPIITETYLPYAEPEDVMGPGRGNAFNASELAFAFDRGVKQIGIQDLDVSVTPNIEISSSPRFNLDTGSSYSVNSNHELRLEKLSHLQVIESESGLSLQPKSVEAKLELPSVL